MSVLSIRARIQSGLAALFIASQALAAPAPSQAPPPSASDTRSADRIPVEVFHGARPKHIDWPRCDIFADEYPSLPGGSHLGVPKDAAAKCQALLSGTGGWVQIDFMVDPKGKPFEVTVVNSTGNSIFEQLATESIERSTFEPASLDGKPVESDYELIYRFSGFGTGATREFIGDYTAVLHAISAGDRAAADVAMKQLKISNLYEDAYVGLAHYTYATKWGDEWQQLAGLQRAIVGQYLPAKEYRAALLACMNLELKTHEYGEAIEISKRLEKAGIDKSTEAAVRTVVEQLNKVRSDDSSYDVQGQITDGTWHLHLFKRHFRAVVTQGSISEVKLRCDRNYVYFAFDPTLIYQISSKDGDCSIELSGESGSRFKLVQF